MTLTVILLFMILHKAAAIPTCMQTVERDRSTSCTMHPWAQILTGLLLDVVVVVVVAHLLSVLWMPVKLSARNQRRVNDVCPCYVLHLVVVARNYCHCARIPHTWIRYLPSYRHTCSMYDVAGDACNLMRYKLGPWREKTRNPTGLGRGVSWSLNSNMDVYVYLGVLVT